MSSGMRIGELARRVGVSTDVLRVWERRFGIFEPGRTPSGYRVYSAVDERRARDLVALKAQGVPLAEAVLRVRSTDDAAVRAAGGATPDEAADLRSAVDEAIATLDEAALTDALGRATRALGVEPLMTEVLVPCLRRLGQLWEDGTLTVAHEHFASHAIRRHLGGLATELPPAGRRAAVVACPTGERHDIVALMVTVVLARRNWSVRFLGGDTPVVAIAAVADQVDADVVVLSVSQRALLTTRAGEVRQLAAGRTLAVGGGGADPALVESLDGRVLPTDPVLAATAIDSFVA